MDLASGEQIIFKTHPSIRSAFTFHFKGFVLAVAAAAIAVAVTAISNGSIDWGWVIGIFVLGLLIVFAVGYIRRHFTTYTVTNERILLRKGLFTKSEQETRLARVQNVSTKQTLMARILKVGTVNIDTAGGSNYNFDFNGIAYPQKAISAIHEAQRTLPTPPSKDSDEV